MHCPLQRNSRPVGAELEIKRAASTGINLGCKSEQGGEGSVGHTVGTVGHRWDCRTQRWGLQDTQMVTAGHSWQEWERLEEQAVEERKTPSSCKGPGKEENGWGEETSKDSHKKMGY